MRTEPLSRGGRDRTLHRHALSPFSLPMALTQREDGRKEMTRATSDLRRTATIERARERWIEDLTAHEVVRTAQPTRAAGLPTDGGD